MSLLLPGMHPRKALRRELRAARRSLTLQQQRRHAASVAKRLARARVFLRARRIAFYWPADGELDPRPLLEQAHRRGKTGYLPVLRPRLNGRRGDRLWFAPYVPGAPLCPNRFGIPEPRSRRGLRLAWNLDLLMMPLVGFDADCNRLGMGGGFYDRTLAYLRRHRAWNRPRLIGLAHACQQVARIEPQPWDIPLEAVVTECVIQVRSFAPQRRKGREENGTLARYDA
ncbi:5-formyltetrahydrofolate cyclo-ligase [Thiobaca trueperi]|uniref:5-formyltetrahydrofolate cyclo-ligase n=2 Tax=Thiobaca trueperi TaxID=127458 RepID=A0A4R3MX60_9GAMM|nr:5-formyltetrahydrofolate cyclo-ligase [Thiobaca trueperi]